MTAQERVVRAYEEYRDALFRYLVHLGLRGSIAQEITQEAFLRLHSAFLDGSDIRQPRAWLFTVAHNLAMASLNEEAGAVAAAADGVMQADAEQQILADERLARLERAVSALSPQQQRCLHLRAEGLRYREIGEVLGIATPTAAEFIRRAVLHLTRGQRRCAAFGSTPASRLRARALRIWPAG